MALKGDAHTAEAPATVQVAYERAYLVVPLWWARENIIRAWAKDAHTGSTAADAWLLAIGAVVYR